MNSRKRFSKVERRRNAQHQIGKLLEMVVQERKTNPNLADRHSKLAWRMSTRFNLKLKERRLLYCHFCKKPILAVEDSRYRIREGELRITCLKCGGIYRKKLRTLHV